MPAEPPPSPTAVLDAVDIQRRKTWRWASATIKKVEEDRERELHRLDRVAAIFEDEEAKAEPASGNQATKAKPKQRQKKRPAPAKAALERREAMLRHMVEQGQPLAIGELRQKLGISDFSARSALKRLIQEGRVIRSGTGSVTRYAASTKARATPGLPQPVQETGTVQGRILAILEDRSSASLAELAQALRMPAEEVRGECGALIREDEVRMARANGRAVYVRQRAA